MKILSIGGKEYKIKFGYNCFCDTDLMDKVSRLMHLMSGSVTDNDANNTMGKIRELFSVARELVYVGLQKYNPVEKIEDVGELLDDYIDDSTEKRNLMSLFTILVEELTNEGFLAGLTSEPEEAED